MNIWSVELRVSPSSERPEPRGFVVHVRAAHSAASVVWAVRGDWMEQPPTLELTKGIPTEIGVETSTALIQALIGAKLTPVPPEAWGIHETTYQLKIWAGMNSSEFTWYGDLPSEWAHLAPAVSTLQRLAKEYAVEA